MNHCGRLPLVFAGTNPVLDVIGFLNNMARTGHRLLACSGYGGELVPIDKIHTSYTGKHVKNPEDAEITSYNLVTHGALAKSIELPREAIMYPGGQLFEFVNPDGGEPLLVACVA